MKETYLLENLLIGKIYVCENLGRSIGPIPTKSNELFIFEIKNDDTVEEIITGDSFKFRKKNRYKISNVECDTYNHIFNKRYAVDTQELSNLLTPEFIEKLNLNDNTKELILGGIIDKWTLVKIYNQLNFELQKNNQKQLKK